MKPFMLFMGLLLSVFGSASLAQDAYSAMAQRNIAKCRLAVKSAPNNAQAQQSLAAALNTSNYKQVGNAVYCNPALPIVQDEAIAHLKRAIALQPNHYDWQADLGLYLNNRGRYQEAIPHLKKSLHLLGTVKPFLVGHGGEPSVMHRAESAYSAHSLLGDAFNKTGRYAEAEAEYRRALLFDPGDAWLLLGLGNALHGEGKRAQSRAAWQKIISLNSKPTFYTKQARAKLAKYPSLP